MSRIRIDKQLELAVKPNMILASNNQNGSNEMVYKEHSTTIANLKTSTQLFYPFVYITDNGVEGIFEYDSTDVTSVNDNINLIVDNTGRRWKRTTDIVNTNLKLTGGSVTGNVSIAGNTSLGTTNQYGLVTVQKDQNANTNIFLTNRGSGTAQKAGYFVDNGSYGVTMEALGSTHATSGSATGNRTRIIANSSPGLAIVSQNDRMSFWTGNVETEKMTIATNGNIGVGTASPSSQLDIKATSGNKAEIKVGSIGVNTDNAITITRTPSYTEFLRIGSSAAGGLFGGQNNNYFIDVVGGSVGTARPINYRFSQDGGSTYNTALTVSANGIGIGTTSPNANSLLELSSTTKGILIPRMTTVQRDAIVAPTEGLRIYNLTTHLENFYNGTIWVEQSINKLETTFSIAELKAYTGSNVAYLDGSVWEKKAGNVASNGGLFPGTIINVSTSFYWERQIINYITPEMFGAIADGVTDNITAINNMFQAIPEKGGEFQFGAGTYKVSDKILPKRIGGITYKITIRGMGKGVTFIEGFGNSLLGKNLMEFNNSVATSSSNSAITISDITFKAGTANHCLYMNKVLGIELKYNEFLGGVIGCLKVGDGTRDNYAVYIHNNYFNANTLNDKQNDYLLNIDSDFAEIYNNVGDGAKHAVISTLSQMNISGNTFEGFKFAGIYANTSKGGNSKITSNNLRPYGLYEASGLFNGIMTGIHIESISGGASSNCIIGNQIYMPTPDELNLVANISGAITAVPSPNNSNLIIGNTTGATGLLLGYNSTSNTVNIEPISGTFIAESVTQSTSGGTFTIASFVTKHTYGINLQGSNGANVIQGNQINGGEWAIIVNSPYNNINGNNIAGKGNGITLNYDTSITNNNIENFGVGTHISFKKIGTFDVPIFSSNKYNGLLDNMNYQQFDKLTTAQKNAIVNPPSNLIIKDTTQNKLSVFDGTKWFYLETSDLRSKADIGSGFDADNIIEKGTYTFGGVANTGSSFGIMTVIAGSSDSDPWTQQLHFGTDGEITSRQRIHSYGTWENKKLWTDKYILPSLTTTATNQTTAVGSPTQTEYNSLVANYNKLLTDFNSLISFLKTKKIMTT